MPSGVDHGAAVRRTLVTLTVSVSPSTSLSFASTAIETAVSSAVVAVSLTAAGASLTAVTDTLTVPVALPPWPSPIV